MQDTRGEDMHDGFVFRGEVLALDLVNTEIMVRGKPRDLLATPADLDRWWTAARGRDPNAGSTQDQQAATPELLAAAKRLRTTLRRICTAVVQGESSEPQDQAMLNDVLATAHLALRTTNGKRQQTYVVTPDGSMLLFQIARSALHLLTECDIARLHTCRNERCVLLFYDTTKSGTRQWCSGQCFNRTRSTENYRRRKAAAHQQL